MANNNYVVIDNASAKIQQMLEEGGSVELNTAFRQLWQDAKWKKISNTLKIILGQTDPSITLTIDTDGTIIVGKEITDD